MTAALGGNPPLWYFHKAACYSDEDELVNSVKPSTNVWPEDQSLGINIEIRNSPEAGHVQGGTVLAASQRHLA